MHDLTDANASRLPRFGRGRRARIGTQASNREKARAAPLRQTMISMLMRIVLQNFDENKFMEQLTLRV